MRDQLDAVKDEMSDNNGRVSAENARWMMMEIESLRFRLRELQRSKH